ncbi:aprataxin and PNK-like factor [Brachyistius frenatus]|uniref:aprataxin and PNK-like factor n=1 Tax=Brachyistius frenatus TaxID=100188 RepID=UPI0037E758C4
MSGFNLVPVDGGDPVHLPPGETVLGRGPFLKISDKRVSRNHGLLENLNGQLRLKPTHLNPCFVQSSLTDDPRPLQKDSWHPLHHGVFLSLLPGQHIYEVAAVGGGEEEHTPRNSQMFENEEEELPDVTPPPADGQDRDKTPPRTPAAASNEKNGGRSLNQGHSALSMEGDRTAVAASTSRRRVLPAWMMAAVAAPTRPSSTPKGRAANIMSSTSSAAAPSTSTTQATPTDTSLPEEAELSEGEEEVKRPRKMRRKMSDGEVTPHNKTDVPSEESTVRYRSKPGRSEVSDQSKNFNIDVEAAGKGNASTQRVSRAEREDMKLENQPTAKRAESVGSDGGSASAPVPSNPRVRTPCPYGKDCYRKNPVHFQESSHPGDTDYEEEDEDEEEEEADRPECPYGTDCYRKNPLHRKEYKHTKRPARTTRPAAQQTPDEDDEDFGDDDSFINDDSEDAGGDSDYVPPDSGDSGKEDVSGLQREAKAFLKRRK